jgi:GMP synthase-like glutamine amidotransferase
MRQATGICYGSHAIFAALGASAIEANRDMPVLRTDTVAVDSFLKRS